MMSGVVWKGVRRCQQMLLLGAFDQMRGNRCWKVCFEAFDGQFIHYRKCIKCIEGKTLLEDLF